MGLVIRNERQLKSLTGLSQKQFDYLLSCFSDVYLEKQQQIYEKGLESGTRIRKPGGGSKGKLPTMADKLVFLLFYYKTYPTFDVLGTQFDMARSKAHINVYKLSPILYDALVRLELMPYRRFETPEDLKTALSGIDRVIIDATERAYRRSEDNEEQKAYYSGKKKQHTIKNTVMSGLDKWIVFVGRTFSGHNHDYKILKEELPPGLDWFEDLHVLVDLGYQGIRSDYSGDQIEIPHKKPRKSKKNPKPRLSDEQRAENKALSKVRVFVEHAIGGMKRYNILVQRFRNRVANFEDDVIGICAGLWNLTLAY
jgi:hypothetical protein